MKKNLFVIYTCIVTVICIVLFAHMGTMNREHEENLQTLWKNYEVENVDLMNENSELERRVADLENQIWNIVNGEDYSVKIKHDGVTHTYARTYDELSFISDNLHIVSIN